VSRDIKNLLAFVVGLFIAAALLLPGAVWAATSVIPDVPGYTSTSAGYTPSAGQLKGWSGTYNSSAKSYPVTGKITLMSKAPVSVSGSVGLVSNAGQLAKTAMKLHPGKLAGTLAAGWLLDQGLQYLDGQWVKEVPGEYSSNYCVAGGASCCTPGQQNYKPLAPYPDGGVNCSVWIDEAPGSCTEHNIYILSSVSATCAPGQPNAGTRYTWNAAQAPTGEARPATDSDWDALPDPTDAVAPELPNAEYMPEGAPVHAPHYDFVPFNAPSGSPYSKPDGSKWQDGVTVSPSVNTTNNNTTNNYNYVNVTNYSTKIENSDGSPVPVPVPEERPDEAQDPCEKNPNTLGCQEMGEFEHDIPKAEHVFEFEPEAVAIVGQCPPDIQILGSALSFAPACGAMSTIKPLVVGMAAVMAAMILFGGMRGAD
jgi:hypothetical protein